MSELLYTVVCRHYTVNGIIELDLYEVFRRLHIDSVWEYERMIEHHVYTGQAVEYVIKKVLRNIDINERTKQFYSKHEPYWLGYDCFFDLKDVRNMNNKSIFMRLNMTDEDFNRVYGRRL